MFIKNCWYVTAWAHEVKAGSLFSRRVCDVPIVLWRDSAGRATALQDRCCHRGAALSLGRIEGDCVRCMYHGLKFDAAGVCVEAPGQEKLPPKARVRKLPLAERHRWIWVWMGEPALADEALIPNARWLEEPDWVTTPPGYLHYDVNYQLINDNLLDFSHLAYVHQKTLGGSEAYARLRPDIERLERGLRITRWQFDVAPAPFVTKIKNYPGNVDRWNIYDFLLPGVLIMHSGFAPTGTGAEKGQLQDAIEFHGCQAVTPETTESSHYFFAMPRNFALDDQEITESLQHSLVEAFEEDRSVITAQAHSIRGDLDFEPVVFVMDTALVQFRRMVTAALARDASTALLQRPARQGTTSAVRASS